MEIPLKRYRSKSFFVVVCFLVFFICMHVIQASLFPHKATVADKFSDDVKCP